MGATGLINIREPLKLNHGRKKRKQGVFFDYGSLLGEVETEKKIHLEKQTVLHVFDSQAHGTQSRTTDYKENRK